MTEIDYALYLAAKPLIEALSAYSDAGTLKAYDDSFKTVPTKKTSKAVAKPVYAPIITAIGETLSATEKFAPVQAALLAELKRQVAALVTAGDLLAVGFRAPRHETDKPMALPPAIFEHGDINWDKSEAVLETTTFTAIRLLETGTQKIAANKFQRSGNVVSDPKKDDLQKLARATGSKQIMEKEAAAYLGLSQRTLQSLRINGGGPVFTKSGQAIRYTLQDLNTWKTDKSGK